MSAHTKIAFVAAAVALALIGAGIAAVPAEAAVPVSPSLQKCIDDNLAAYPEYNEETLPGIDCTPYNDLISSLAGIQNFPQFVGVTFDGAPDADGDLSPLSSLVNMQDLTIHDFNITNTAPLDSLPNIDRLDLSHNDLSTIAPGIQSSFMSSLDLSYNNFSSAASISTISGGLSEVYVEGNHLTSLAPLDSCEVYDASGQTVTAPATTAGVATPIPTLTDGNGNPVDDVQVADDSAVAGSINAGSVTWATSGTGTLSWDYTFQSVICGGTGHYSGTITQSVAPGAITPAPTVTSVSPSTGTTSGGTAVTITGAGFTGASAVHFGSASASFVVSSDTSIIATAPAATAGPVDVTVTAPGGTSSTGSADQFGYQAPPPAPPAITAVAPNSGSTAGGTSVTITGTGLTGTTAVHFASASASFTVNSSTSVTATAPAGLPGSVDVTVTTPAGTSVSSAADTFDYVLPAPPVPTVTNVSPNRTSTIDPAVVTITGTHFTGATSVNFGDSTATTFTVDSDTTITATLPAEGAGVADLRVVTPAGTSAITPADQFTWVTGPPAVNGFAPQSGGIQGGTVVTLVGTDFTGVSAVTFGGVSATSFTFVSWSKIQAVAPAHAAGPVSIEVTTPVGTGTSTAQFTYTPPIPAVADVSPGSGSTAGGTAVTITGTTFTGATSVRFSSAPATFTVNSDSSIAAVAPAGVAGPVDVTVTTSSGTSVALLTDEFDYLAPPAVSAIAPQSGDVAGGTSVTVSGSGFTGATAVNFDSVPATSFSVDSDNSITAIAPAGSGAGPVDLTVTTLLGTSPISVADVFTYTQVSVAPVITGVSPATGSTAGGTLVIVSGSNLGSATTVTFGGTAASILSANFDGSLNVSTPAHAVGSVEVVVTTPAGTDDLANGFTFVSPNAPVLTDPEGRPVKSYRPDRGSQLGGTVITLEGLHLYPALSVTIGGVSVPFTGQAAAPRIGSSTTRVPDLSQLTFTTPGSATPGVVPIVVTTIAGSLTLNFTYLAVKPPVLIDVKGDLGNGGPVPSRGSQLGGTSVELEGANVYPALSVTIGGVTVPFTGRVLPLGQSGVPLSEVTFTTPGSVTAGVVPVVLTTLAGSVTAKFRYEPANAPVLVDVKGDSGRGGPVPSRGSQLGGTSVELEGTDVYPALSVTIGGVSVPFTGRVLPPRPGTFTTPELDLSEVTFTTPGSVTAGVVPIVLTTLAGSLTVNFRYEPENAPVLVDVKGNLGRGGPVPSRGSQLGGTSVELEGTDVYPAVSVTIGGVSVPFTGEVLPPRTGSFTTPAPDLSEVTFTTPGSITAGAAPVVLTTLAGSVTVRFIYEAAKAPVLINVKGDLGNGAPAPSRGSQLGGTSVELEGTDVYPALSVTIGGIAVPFTGRVLPPRPGTFTTPELDLSEVTFTTPGSVTAGVVPIVLTTLAGSLTVNFRYEPARAPVLVDVKGGLGNGGPVPSRGSQLGGTTVELEGTDVYPALSVTIGGVAVPFTGRVLPPRPGTSTTPELDLSEVTFVTPGSLTTGAVPIVLTTLAGSVTVEFIYN